MDIQNIQDCTVGGDAILVSDEPELSSLEELKQEEDWNDFETGPEEGVFDFCGRYVMVTYNRSQVTDHTKFSTLLQSHIQAQMPVLGQGSIERAGFNFYGAQELHQDGTPHYHVVFRFDKKVHWRDARNRFAIPLSGQSPPAFDTTSIRLNPLRSRQDPKWFLSSTQAYVAKESHEGNDRIIGAYIQAEGLSKSRGNADEVCRRVHEAQYEDEARSLLIQHFPSEYIWRYSSVEAFLRRKKKRSVLASSSKRTYKSLPYRLPSKVKRWYRENFSEYQGGRHTCLILIGGSRYGKTEWGLSFGKPFHVAKQWVMDDFSDDCTHAVLSDVDVDRFPYWREFIGCQTEFGASGKYREERTLRLDKPVIWTCNLDNSPLRDPAVERYVREAGATVVVLHRKLY